MKYLKSFNESREEYKLNFEKGHEEKITREEFKSMLRDLENYFGDRMEIPEKKFGTGKITHGSVFNDYISFFFKIDEFTSEDKKYVDEILTKYLAPLGWSNISYSYQPGREEGNLWFTMSTTTISTNGGHIA